MSAKGAIVPDKDAGNPNVPEIVQSICLRPGSTGPTLSARRTPSCGFPLPVVWPPRGKCGTDFAIGQPRAVCDHHPCQALRWHGPCDLQACPMPRERSGAWHPTAVITHRNPRRSRAVCLMKIASPPCIIQEKNLLRRLSSEALRTRGAFVRCRRCALVPSDAVR
jgi:hypothetical protein